MALNKHELEFMFGKIRNMRNLSNLKSSSLPIVMSRTHEQNGLLFVYLILIGSVPNNVTFIAAD